MKRKVTYLLIVLSVSLVCIGLFRNIPSGKAYPYYELHYFDTDKEAYFNDQSINISASWELFYDEMTEIAAVKIKIFNFSEECVWETPWLPEKGLKEESWSVEICTLDDSFENRTNYFSVKFVYYYEILVSGGCQYFIEEIPIETSKINISCELVDYEEYVLHGEELLLDVHLSFFNHTTGISENLSSFLVLFELVKVEDILFEENYTTNFNGRVNINLTEKLQLGPGNYKIKIFYPNNVFFNNDVPLMYNLQVNTTSKANITCELIDFEPNVSLQQKVSIQARFSFYNETKGIEENITLFDVLFRLIKNEEVLFENNFTTDNGGMIQINLTNFVQLKVGKYQFNFSYPINDFFNQNISESYDLYVNITSKANLSCILINYNTISFVGQDISIEAFFNYYNETTEKNENLTLSLINFRLLKNKEVVFVENYTTDIYGRILINLTNSVKLGSGNYQMKFSCPDNYFFEENITKIYDLYIHEMIEQEALSKDVQKRNTEDSTTSFLAILSIFSIGIIVLLILAFVKLRGRSKDFTTINMPFYLDSSSCVS
ncbi:MAG: hypothetical protein GF383_06440 [Candidatus Lokiarchaeota archaeon]|nr:hypothetical protein [Candidatus Lokiarchaeota archaeon]MBD3339693.1 hypothetical protein [Candidatus Lokiarchaeota archaeon]